jgi:hypothetical protein
MERTKQANASRKNGKDSFYACNCLPVVTSGFATHNCKYGGHLFYTLSLGQEHVDAP